MIIGITGNSGSGKTTVANILAKMIDAMIIDADQIVKEEQKPDKEYYSKIVEIMGTKILDKKLEIDRKKLAKLIYGNDGKREQVNFITKSYIVPIIIKEAKNSIKQNVLLDVPLLFESNLDEICDSTIAVIANNKTKLARLKLREDKNNKTAKKRLKIQPKEDYYINKADYIIENNDEDLVKKVEEIREKICLKHGKN